MTPHKPQSLATRLSLRIVSLGSLVFLLVLSSNYFLARDLLQDYVEELAKETAQAMVDNIDSTLNSVAISARSLAAAVDIPNIDSGNIHDMIQAFVAGNPHIYGMSVALEPGGLVQSAEGFAPYYFKDADDTRLAFANLNTDSYNYREWPWYSVPKATAAPVWSEPYMDTGGGNVHMVTYSQPIMHQGRFTGVATADIRLSWLDDIAGSLRHSDSGYAFIVSKQDVIISHPDHSLHMVPLQATGISDTNWQTYLHARDSAEPAYFATECRLPGGRCWVAIQSLPSNGWKVVLLIPHQELARQIQWLTVKNAAISLAGLVILFLLVTTITRRQTRPLAKLAKATRDIGAGRFDTALPAPEHNDEIGALNRDFSVMQVALKKYMDDLKQSTAQRQKLESEIEIAHDIQMSMLPGGGDISLREKGLQLYAHLQPARSVGGDLYYYQLDESAPQRQLHFIIGDVSDKGVPAALFMAKTVTLYTRALKEGLSPGQTLSMMNELLSQNNEACMFVTALCGRLNLDTGEMCMANAGHMNPLIVSGCQILERNIAGGTALGLMEAVDYPDINFQLSDGSLCLMYTDGISEAHNRHNEQYGEQRLQALLQDVPPGNAETAGKRIIDEVRHFSAGREQFDDITLLLLYYAGSVDDKPEHGQSDA